MVGTDAKALRPVDSAFVREYGGMRWYRCLRLSAWLPLPPPQAGGTQRSARAETRSICRCEDGRLRNKDLVLRLIAMSRALHFLVLGSLAVLAFVLASIASGSPGSSTG